MHLRRSRLEQELHQLARGRAAHDRVVDDHDPAAVERGAKRVELELHAPLAEPLVGLDERPSHVAVLHEALAVRDAAPLRVADRGRRSGVGDADDDVGVGRSLVGEPRTHPAADVVQGLALHQGVGAGEVDELEDAERPAVSGHRLTEAGALLVDDHQLARPELALEAGADQVERTGLGCSTHASSRRPTTSGRIPSGSRKPASGPLREDDGGECALDVRHGVGHRVGQVVGRVLGDERGDHLGVGRRLEADAPLAQVGAERRRVRQVAVVPERDRPVARVAHDGLGVLPYGRSRGGVAGVADRDVAGETRRRGSSNTWFTRPMSFIAITCEPSETAIPALSWPRCWSA